MILPKKNRLAIYSELFKEGVLVGKKDVSLKTHVTIPDVPNLHVLKLMLSLKSRGYVSETFNWQWYYWYLTEEGVEYLRQYLHLPSDIVPNSHKKPMGAPAREGGYRRERDFHEGGKDFGAGHEFKPNYGNDNANAGFGRGAGGF